MFHAAQDLYVLLPNVFAPVYHDRKFLRWHALDARIPIGPWPVSTSRCWPNEVTIGSMPPIAVISGANPANYCQSTLSDPNERVVGMSEVIALMVDLPFSSAVYHQISTTDLELELQDVSSYYRQSICASSSVYQESGNDFDSVTKSVIDGHGGPSIENRRSTSLCTGAWRSPSAYQGHWRLRVRSDHIGPSGLLT
jgi:hypothetical protein